jgi:hypothetical protein
MIQFWISGLRAAIRGRSFWAIFLFGIALVFVAYLSGSFSPRQPRTVALDVGLSGIRITLVLLNIFWIQELLAKEIDRKSVLFSLTYPVARTDYVLGRYLAVLTMSMLAVVVFGLSLVVVVSLTGGFYYQEFAVVLGWPLIATLFGIFVDVSVVAAFAIWVSSISSVTVMPIATGFAFAIAGKALGATMDYLAGGADGDQQLAKTYDPLIAVIRWVLPDLSRLDWRDWPMYGKVLQFDVALASLVMACCYILLMLMLTASTIRKREFY